MTPLLEARGLSLSGRLHPTDLVVEAPALVALIGPNGSGKTSLLHAVAGIGGPAGEVRIDGVPLPRASADARLRLLSYLPASREAAWPVTARDLVALGLPAGAEEEMEWVLERLDLGPLADRRVDRLSTGERSRVLIARALAPRPRLLLLDEPIANLDPYWQLRLVELLGELVAGGQAAIVALHDLDLADRCADRLILMDSGAVAEDGAPEPILAGETLKRVFGVERTEKGWRPLSPTADRRSSP